MDPADQQIAGDTEPFGPLSTHDPYAALRLRDFRWFLAGNMLALLGLQMQTVAVSWEVYARTGSNLALAMVGLVQVLPVIGLFLPAGHFVDRFDRRKILLVVLPFAACCSLGLAWNSAAHGPIAVTYLFLMLVGTARAFLQPARAAFLPQVVAREHFSNAVTWNSAGFQLAMVMGPALGGPLVGWLNPWVVYLLNAGFALTFCGLLWTIPPRPFVPSTEPVSLRSLGAGLSFVWRTKVMLGAITLDMFAVLLGGATALLPVYAQVIFNSGPEWFGWMRATPGIGAVCMSFVLAHRPPLERAGRALLLSVAGFGVATIIFGYSRLLGLSFAMLFLLGALDMISVVVRHTLVQLLTPEAMRGRVSAVNGLFIGISNELGEFESGSVAWLFDRPDDPAFGPTVAVVSGGVGTLLVVASVALQWPEVRQYGRLDDRPSSPAAA
jgi:MFS family permease